LFYLVQFYAHGSALKGVFTLSSPSELKALAFYATLPVPVVPSQTFAPRLPIHYQDATGAVHEGRPDALCTQPRSYTNIEAKNGRLNAHRSKASSHWALQQEYARTMHDGRDHPYNFYTAHFEKAAPVFLLANAWNHSLYKLLALQALHGWSRFIVCFKRNPSAADAEWYASQGLVFCTEATLNQMLGVIELAAHGLYYPFRLDARRSRYVLTVDPGPGPDHADMTPEQIAAVTRASYVAIATSPANVQTQDAF
jgi:hypothetical protein